MMREEELNFILNISEFYIPQHMQMNVSVLGRRSGLENSMKQLSVYEWQLEPHRRKRLLQVLHQSKKDKGEEPTNQEQSSMCVKYGVKKDKNYRIYTGFSIKAKQKSNMHIILSYFSVKEKRKINEKLRGTENLSQFSLYAFHNGRDESM